MRALRIQMSGDPRAMLALVELPEPEPGAGELLVELLASPISPMDRLMVRGLYPLHVADGIGGAQGVARVLALGEGVVGPEPGTAVLLPARCGAWRERLSVPADSVVALPPGRDPIGACTLRIEALSAAVLLDELEPGECFIHSPGAGSVGRYLTILARERGLRSIALVGSREPIADLWGLGADNVLVREPNLAERLTELGLPQPRVAFDGSGGPVSELLGSCLQVGGELLVYGAVSRLPVQLSVDQLVFRDLRARGFWLHRWAQAVGPEALGARLETLAASDLHEQVVGCFDLADWAEAFNQAELPGARGRVVFTPRPK
ncbi:MAG: 2-enoyl thioester reductase domain-containing protein [Enhygromyxa sp.]